MRNSPLGLLPLLLLAGCGGHHGGSSDAGVPSAVSTDVESGTSNETTEIYSGGVASSDFGALPPPTRVTIIQSVGTSSFTVEYTDAANDRVSLVFTDAAGSTHSGTFASATGTGAYAALSGATGYFTYTPNAGEMNVSTLRISPKPIKGS